MASTAKDNNNYPQDLVAIFHASFHPTQGNVVDWSLKADAYTDVNLDNLEYSALPSGLHLVDEDVVYFTTKSSHHGVCIFRRRPTSEHGHRGFRLSSLGILLQKSTRPRPWRHTAKLKEVVSRVFDNSKNKWLDGEAGEGDWEVARAFFEERKAVGREREVDVGWDGWSAEWENPGVFVAEQHDLTPTLHLPHLLRILGPSALTLYKHVLGRRRILIFTLPPVEAACILCQVAADLCFEYQSNGAMKGKSREGINVLGMVTLNDLDRMKDEGTTGRGWIACTTDAIFLERPSYYDLIIDMTTSTPNKATRPTMHVSRPCTPTPGSSSSSSSQRGPSHRLSVVRFAWSDVKLWTELDRILLLDADSHTTAHDHQHQHQHQHHHPSKSTSSSSRFISTWTDAWRVYEDVCIICAGLWMGSWRSNSTSSYASDTAGGWGSVRLEGDDDLSLDGLVRTVGGGIEGRKSVSVGRSGGIENIVVPAGTAATTATASGSGSGASWASGRATNASPGKQPETKSQMTLGLEQEEEEEEEDEMDARRVARDGQIRTTLALLQTFHANTCFQLSQLETLLVRDRKIGGGGGEPVTLYLTPKDILSFELGPLSGGDARYLEWLVEEYGGVGARVNLKRSWKDLFGFVLGYG